MVKKDDDFTIDGEDKNLDDSVVAEEHAQESIKKLRNKLKEAEAKAKEYLDGWQRAQADFVNMRKRDEEAKKEFMKFVSLEVVEDLIPVLDALTIGGNEPVYRLIMQTLGKHGLEEINPEGEAFDPKEHESIGITEVESKADDHKVIEIMQKGYKLHGKVLRPARVRVGEFSD